MKPKIESRISSNPPNARIIEKAIVGISGIVGIIPALTKKGRAPAISAISPIIRLIDFGIKFGCCMY